MSVLRQHVPGKRQMRILPVHFSYITAVDLVVDDGMWVW